MKWDFDIAHLVKDVQLPRVCRVHQVFAPQAIEDLGGHVAGQVRSQIAGRDLAGKSIAITVGSRGINGLPEILRSMIAELRAAGAEPFIVPTMGSHAGADAEKQTQFIAALGVTEASVGAPVRSSMETVVIGHLEDGMPIYCDRIAAEADGIVVMNKIRPHADFKGDVESGLCKMMAIGLGKRDGAAALHLKGFACFPEVLPRIAKCFLEKLNILFGVGIVENAYDRPVLCEVIPPERIIEREKELLRQAKAHMPLLQLQKIDVLIVDQIGKNISGQGMDPNVTGRTGSPVKEGFNADFVDRIVVLGLTKETHGAFAGLGMADFSTIRLIDELDFEATYVNEITSRVIPPAHLPFFTKNDEQAVRMAIYVSDAYASGDIALVHIRDTSHLEDIEVSEKALRQMADGTYTFGGAPAPVWQDLHFEDGRLRGI